MNVLFADDDSKMHLILTLWLKKHAHEVDCVSDGQKALQLLEKQSYDILITDVNMPLVNGIELIHQAMALLTTPPLIIVLTSRCDIPELRNEIADASVHLFNKPFSPSALMELIDKLEQKKNQEAVT